MEQEMAGGRPLKTDVFEMRKSLLSWRSILGGLFVAFLTMIGLMGLGMAVGGIGLQDGARMGNAGLFTGVWAVVSLLISVFAGSYFAARTLPESTPRTGGAHGLVIASFVLMFALWQTMAAVTVAGTMAGQAVWGAAQVAGQGVAQISESGWMNHVVEDAIGEMNLRSEPQVVASGVVSRLLAGNPESAKLYLARQSNMSAAEVDQRIAGLQAEFGRQMTEAREGAAKALQATGWTLFISVLLAALSSAAGGALGARLNLRSPLTTDMKGRTNLRPATV